MTEAVPGLDDDLMPVVVVVVVCVVLFCASLLLVAQRRRMQPVQRVRAGREVAVGPPGPAVGRWRLPHAVPPSLARDGKRPPTRQFVLSDQGVPRQDPTLTVPVMLTGTWFDSVCHGSRVVGGARLAFRAATVRGVAHVHDDRAGQDAAALAWNDHRHSLFAVVADGLGSLPDSGDVAATLVEQVMLQSGKLGARDDPQGFVTGVIRSVRDDAGRRGLDGATTMLLAEIRLDQDGAAVKVWAVGDSEAWMLQDTGWRAIHQERRGDAENVTRHVPGPHEPVVVSCPAPSGSVIVLGTDGFTGALDSHGSQLARELGARWQDPPAPVDFLAQVDFLHPYFLDDRAAVAVWIR